MRSKSRRSAFNPSDRLYEHVAEYYKLNTDSIGRLLRVIEIHAHDSREAFFEARKHLGSGEMVALFQGSTDRYGVLPVAFGGDYTPNEWKRLLGALGGNLSDVSSELKRKSAEYRKK